MYCVFWFLFFKQKTAYEMRISDWSSDVCSSDLCSTGERNVLYSAHGRSCNKQRPRQRLRGKFIFGKAGPGGCDHQPVKLRSGKGAARRTLERHLQRFAAASIGREAAKAPTIPECNPQITRSVDGHPVWRALPFAKAGKNPAVRGFARLVQFKLIDKLRGGVGMIHGAAIGAESRAIGDAIALILQ